MTAVDFSALEPAPMADARRVRPGLERDVRKAEELLRAHGAVSDGKAYPVRSRARWRARRLMHLLMSVAEIDRWSLAERTWQEGDSWRWAVELVGDGEAA